MNKCNKILSITLVCVITLLACDPNDDENPMDQLVGTWDVTSVSITGCSDPQDNSPNGEDIIGCFTDSGFEFCRELSITFTVDGNMVWNFRSSGTNLATDQTFTEDETETSTFSVDGDRVTICTDGDCGNGTFTVTDGALSLSGFTELDNCTTTFGAEKRPD